jgi:hypothetical protein
VKPSVTVTVPPEIVLVVPDRVNVTNAVVVTGGAVIVVKDPEIDVVTVVPGSVVVVRINISEVTVTAGRVDVFVTIIVLLRVEVAVIVEAGWVIVVRDPEIDVVTVDAG